MEELKAPPLLFNHLAFSVTIALCISVRQEIKARGKLPLSQAAPCQKCCERMK